MMHFETILFFSDFKWMSDTVVCWSSSWRCWKVKTNPETFSVSLQACDNADQTREIRCLDANLAAWMISFSNFSFQFRWGGGVSLPTGTNVRPLHCKGKCQPQNCLTNKFAVNWGSKPNHALFRFTATLLALKSSIILLQDRNCLSHCTFAKAVEDSGLLQIIPYKTT